VAKKGPRQHTRESQLHCIGDYYMSLGVTLYMKPLGLYTAIVMTFLGFQVAFELLLAGSKLEIWNNMCVCKTNSVNNVSSAS